MPRNVEPLPITHWMTYTSFFLVMMAMPEYGLPPTSTPLKV